MANLKRSLDEQGVAKLELLSTELRDQTDRGVAIIAGAWVEEELGAAIRETLLDEAALADGFLGRLHLFGKINLARLLGFISADIAEDLHHIRNIRNDFAHDISEKNFSPLTFATASVQQRCLALKCVAHLADEEPRQRYIHACASLTKDLHIQRMFTPRITEGTFGLIHVEGLR